MRSQIPTVGLLIVLLTTFSHTAIAQTRLGEWEIFELTLKTNRSYDNPYAAISAAEQDDGVVRANFTGLTGDARGKSITISGFWYAGQTWKVRFAPPASGIWEYRTTSSDRSLNNKRGRIEVFSWSPEEKSANPTRHGFVQVMRTGPNPGRYFQYADGTPFLWIGDTWWNWTKKKIEFETFKTLVDDRAAK